VTCGVMCCKGNDRGNGGNGVGSDGNGNESYDSARTLSMFSFTQAVLSWRLALGNKLLSASRVCRLVLYISSAIVSCQVMNNTYTLMRS
jgi:hypothetical protein